MNAGEVDPLISSNGSRASYSDQDSMQSLKLAISFLLLTLIISQTFFVVPPGTIGIVVTLGHVVAFESGIHVKMPFLSELINLTAKTQKLEEENNIPTSEGLSVRLDTAV